MVGADGPERDHTRRKWQSSSYPASLKPKLCFQLLAAGHEAAPRGPAPLLSLPTCSVQRQFGKVITGPSKHPQPPLTSGSLLAALANVPVLSTPSCAPSCSCPPALQPYGGSPGGMTPSSSYQLQHRIERILEEDAVRYQLWILPRVTRRAASSSSPHAQKHARGT